MEITPMHETNNENINSLISLSELQKDLLGTTSDLMFVRKMWRYHRSRFNPGFKASSLTNFDVAIGQQNPILKKEDIKILDLFVDHLKNDVYPTLRWNEDGTTEPYQPPELKRLLTIFYEIRKTHLGY